MTYRNHSRDQEGLLNWSSNNSSIDSEEKAETGTIAGASRLWNFLPLLVPAVMLFSVVGNLFVVYFILLVRRFRR